MLKKLTQFVCSLQVQHFKDVELTKIQIQEKERSRKDGEDHRLKLDKMYQLKAETLIAREKNAIERLQKQQEVGLNRLEKTQIKSINK